MDQRVLVECGGAERFVATVGAETEIETEEHEDEECEDLRGQTGDHEVVACGWVGMCVRGLGSDTTACRLQQQRQYVAGDELFGQHASQIQRRRRERTIRVYDSGLMREFSGPNAYTILRIHK